MLPRPPREKFASDKDKVYLEDHSQRIQLSNINNKDITTGTVQVYSQYSPFMCITVGMIIGIKGIQHTDGTFQVEDYCLPGLPLQRDPLPSLSHDK